MTDTTKDDIATVREVLDFIPRHFGAQLYDGTPHAALSRLETQLARADELAEAARVYASDLHLCSTRPCFCGAYSSVCTSLSTYRSLSTKEDG